MKIYKGLLVPVEPKREWKEWMLSEEDCPLTETNANCGGISCRVCIYSICNTEQRACFYKDTFNETKEANMNPIEKNEDSQALIARKCDEIKELLLEKNRKYGDSALNPVRIFSKADAKEQILIRMDDKVNRIMNEQTDEDEDVIKDLVGYGILYLIARDKE